MDSDTLELAEVPTADVASISDAVHARLTRPKANRSAAILAGWREAWLTRRENPLCAAWELADKRRGRGVLWWRRSPGLLITAIFALAAGATVAGLAIVMGGHLSWSDWDGWSSGKHLLLRLGSYVGSTGELEYSAVLAAGMSSLLAALAWACAWLMSRYYTTTLFAYGFLCRESRSMHAHTYDDLLAAAPLTEQEVVIGCLYYALRRLAPPLLLVCGLGALVLLQANAESDVVFNDPLNEPLLLVLVFCSVGCMLTISCLLSITFLLGVGLTLGQAPQRNVWPALGAASMMMFQVLLAVVIPVMAFSSEPQYVRGAYPAEFLTFDRSALFNVGENLSFLAFMAACITLYLLCARRLAWLRMLLQVALPVMLYLPYSILVSLYFGAHQEAGSVEPPYSMLLPYEGLGVVNAWLPWTVATSMNGLSVYEWSRYLNCHWLALVGYQLLLALLATEFARDAVRRRKWGAA